jgi:hypothetical protein
MSLYCATDLDSTNNVPAIIDDDRNNGVRITGAGLSLCTKINGDILPDER